MSDFCSETRPNAKPENVSRLTLLLVERVGRVKLLVGGKRWYQVWMKGYGE
jgi:hypothetical protein